MSNKKPHKPAKLSKIRLATGTYFGLIEVKSGQAPNSPLGVKVVVSVVPAPFCSYTVGPASASLLAAGGPGSLTVGAADYCSWAASIPIQYQSWIKLTSAATGSGNGTVSYSLTANTGTAQRQGKITVSGQDHVITQFGSTCAFSISPGSVNIPAAGGGSNIAVTASGSSCGWTATSNASWIQVTSRTPGTGSGSVSITMDENKGGSGAYERLTFFSDFPGYKASNPVVSDDGRFLTSSCQNPGSGGCRARNFHLRGEGATVGGPPRRWAMG